MRKDLEEVFNKYKDNVFAIGFNYFRNESDADDVVQETFWKFARCNKAFESDDHIRNWIIRVAVNECKRVTLSCWFKKREPLEEYVSKLAFTQAEQSEVFEEVMNLPAKYRQVVHLYYYEDYSTAEIADILEISRSNVTTRLNRGRKLLRGVLTEVWRNE